MGAKNHAIIMPDADKDDAINAMIGACFGSSGQRCMAIAVTVMVGEAQDWIPEIVEKAKTMTIGAGVDNTDLSPMITKASLDKAVSIISQSDNNGSKILLDGRGVKVDGYPNGNFLGQTIIDHAKPGMACVDEEIFAPVMVIIRVDTLQEAIDLINENPYGNGSSIFTRSGGNARKYQHEI